MDMTSRRGSSFYCFRVRVYKGSQAYEQEGQYLIIWEGGRSGTPVLSHIALAGGSVQGLPSLPSKVRHLCMEMLFR